MTVPDSADVPLSAVAQALDPREFKLHCAVYNGVVEPLDELARSWDAWERWNKYRPGRDEFNRRFIFSLAQVYHEQDRWMFGGVFEVLGGGDVPHSHSYEIRFREDLLPGCTARLKLAFTKRYRSTRLNLEGVIDQISVAEVLPSAYGGEPFPGHDAINHSFKQLRVIYEQQRADWRIALEQMKGVYVLHDTQTGDKYVGAAYGDTGVWARWGEYIDSGHGNNEELRELASDKGLEYIHNNFTFALLEFWSMRTADEHVVQRESYWKDVLLSRKFGYNAN